MVEIKRLTHNGLKQTGLPISFDWVRIIIRNFPARRRQNRDSIEG